MAYDVKKDKNPMAVNILKLQRYNFKFFSLEEVIFFEYLIVKAQSFGFKQFFHSTAVIEKETGLKRHKLDSIIDKFKKLNILEIELKGFPVVKHFTVNLEIIQGLLSQIYQVAENGKLPAEIIKLLGDFYNPLVDKYKQKNNKKETSKETKKEIIDRDSDWILFIENFNEKLLNLKVEHRLKESQIKYTEDILFLLYSNYPEDVIFNQLTAFFTNENSFEPKLSDFLKTEPLSQKKNTFIEKNIFSEKQFAKNLIERLSQLFNDRRETNSTTKKKYSHTALAINNAIIAKVVEVLRVKSENEIRNAFVAYADAIITDKIQPDKILPYFFAQKFGEYSVIDTYLDYFNVRYSITSK